MFYDRDFSDLCKLDFDSQLSKVPMQHPSKVMFKDKTNADELVIKKHYKKMVKRAVNNDEVRKPGVKVSKP